MNEREEVGEEESKRCEHQSIQRQTSCKLSAYQRGGGGILRTAWQRRPAFIRGHFANPTNKTHRETSRISECNWIKEEAGWGWIRVQLLFACPWHNPTIWMNEQERPELSPCSLFLAIMLRCAVQPKSGKAHWPCDSREELPFVWLLCDRRTHVNSLTNIPRSNKHTQLRHCWTEI